MSGQRSLTILLTGALVALPGAAPANAEAVTNATDGTYVQSATSVVSASTSAAIKRRFGVFRRNKTKRDVIPTRKRKRAAALKIDSRLVYSAAKFKVYLHVRDNQVCIARVNRSSAAGTCGPLRSYLTATPPALLMLAPTTAMITAEVIIPAVDGVRSITRVNADGTRIELAVRNNIVVDTPDAGDHYEWKQPSGVTATLMDRR